MPDSFDAFRKKLQQKRTTGPVPGGEPEPEVPAAVPLPAAGRPPAPPPEAPTEPEEDDAGMRKGGLKRGPPDALERMRSARARLDALKGKPEDPPAAQESPARDPDDRPKVSDALRAAREAAAAKAKEAAPAASKLDALRAKARPSSGGLASASRPGHGGAPAARPGARGNARFDAAKRSSSGGGAGGGGGDDFDSFRRAKANDNREDAKKRAFEEGVEVEVLDRSRLAHDRAERQTAEELGVTRHHLVQRFGDEADNPDDPVAEQFDGERPERFDSHRVKRLAIVDLGELDRPAGYDSHHAKRKSADELELEPPEGLQSHRHKKTAIDDEKDEDGKPVVSGFKRHEF